jgi:DNA primase
VPAGRAAALETIDRIGPCRAEFEVHDLEDVRAAKRQRVVDRATELLAEFEETSLSSRELVEEVRQNVRVADITEFEGVPAGPRVAESDAIVVVEGRADVLQLLKYGVKNAIAVEGTDVPDAVAELTRERTVTAFLDGDRGGDLILEELVQVGSIDYVAIAPAGRSVEDLSRGEVLSALREKILYDRVADASSPRDVLLEDEGPPDGRVDADGGTLARGASTDPTVPEDTDPDAEPSPEAEPDETTTESEETPQTLAGHTEAVDGTGTVRLLDETFDALAEADAGETFAAIEDAETVPHAVVLDGELSQRVLDVAAQRGVRQIVADSEGEFVKRPTGVRVRTADEF